MKTLLIVLFSVVVAVLATEEDVVVLTDASFDDWIKNQELALVEFYAPWCGHCKNLAPEYAIAAEQLKKNDPPIALAKVDATVESKVAARFDVKGYPTLKVFRKGTAADYKGPRDNKGIVAYMQKQAGPSAKPLATVEDTKKFITKDRDVTIIGFFPTKTAAAEEFLKAADQLREDFRFGYVSDKSVLSAFEGVPEGTVLFRGEQEKVVYTGGNLVSWVWDVSVPKVGEVTKDNFKRYQRKGLPILKVYGDVSGAKQATYYLNRLKKAAEDSAVSDKLNFAIANSKDFKDELDKFGVNGQGSVVIDDFSNSLKYKYSGGFSVENVLQFAKDFVEKKLKPYIKSEPIPAPSTDAVKTVVGETWNDIVMDPTKDVLIELYAPWCGHCKKLAPTYEELAKSLSGVSNLVIAKMDATANDTPHGKYQAKGFPTIFFAKANDKENPMTYSGAREVKDFTDFLKKNANAAKWEKKAEL